MAGTTLIVYILFSRNPNLEEQAQFKFQNRRKIDKVTKFDKANKGWVDKIEKTSCETLQISNRIKWVTHEYRGLLQEPCEHIIPGWHQKCMCLSIMHQNMCAVPEYNSGLLLSQRRPVSIDLLIFSTTDSNRIVQTPPSFESVYWMLYYIITRAICK